MQSNKTGSNSSKLQVTQDAKGAGNIAADLQGSRLRAESSRSDSRAAPPGALLQHKTPALWPYAAEQGGERLISCCWGAVTPGGGQGPPPLSSIHFKYFSLESCIVSGRARVLVSPSGPSKHIHRAHLIEPNKNGSEETKAKGHLQGPELWVQESHFLKSRGGSAQ